MLCPYCSEYIRDDALRCKVCAGDLVLYRFLREKAAASVGQNYASGGTPDRNGPTQRAIDSGIGDERHDHRPIARSLGPLRHAIGPLVICIVLLIATYWLVGIVLRADGFPLRLISILVPVPLGIWFALHERPTHGAMLGAACAVPTLAMIGGRTLAAISTGEAFLHRDHTWDYLLSYWASMAFSFLTGAYIGHVVHRHSHISPRSVARNSTERRRELIAKAKQLGPVLGPVGTAVAAVVTGVGDYLAK